MSKKNILISLSLVVVFSLIFFLIKNKENEKGPKNSKEIKAQDIKNFNDEEKESAEIPTADMKLNENSGQKIITPSQIDMGGKDRPLTEEEMDQLESYYERTEKEWDQKVANIFSQFALPKEAFAEYEKLRESYEEAKMDAFQEFQNKMIEKYGENYEYNPSDEQEGFDQKVNEKYQAQLKKLIGEQNYPKYSEMRDQFNERIGREQNPELGKMSMDL